MKSIVCKLAALSLLLSLGVMVFGPTRATHINLGSARQPVADGGQWGQKGGKGVC